VSAVGSQVSSVQTLPSSQLSVLMSQAPVIGLHACGAQIVPPWLQVTAASLRSPMQRRFWQVSGPVHMLPSSQATVVPAITSTGGLHRKTGSQPSAVHGLVSGRQTRGGLVPGAGRPSLCSPPVVQLFPVVGSHTSMPSQRLLSSLHGSTAARSFSVGMMFPFAPMHAPFLHT